MSLFQSVRSRLFAGNHGRDVLQEINAALVARPSVPLFMFARGTLVAQRGVAFPAETRHIACLGAAFRAVHFSILALVRLSAGEPVRACVHTVTPVRLATHSASPSFTLSELTVQPLADEPNTLLAQFLRGVPAGPALRIGRPGRSCRRLCVWRRRKKSDDVSEPLLPVWFRHADDRAE